MRHVRSEDRPDLLESLDSHNKLCATGLNRPAHPSSRFLLAQFPHHISDEIRIRLLYEVHFSTDKNNTEAVVTTMKHANRTKFRETSCDTH